MSVRSRSITTAALAAGMLLAASAAGLGPDATAAATLVPFQATYSGLAAFTSETTVTFEGAGVATHLGLGVDLGDATITGPDSSCPGGLANVHVERLTAANGDTLTILAHNVACPVGPLQFRGSGTWVATGGTGRFDAVTGSGTFRGSVDFATQEFTFELSGMITPPGG